jgi:predicted dehydrogenase
VQRRTDTGADATSAFQIRFAKETLAQFLVTQSASSFFYEMDIHGSAGTIALRGRNFLQFEIEVSSSAVATYSEPTFIRPAVRRDNITMMLMPELEEFARAIQEHRSPMITVADGRRVLQVLDAVMQSGRCNQPVSLADCYTNPNGVLRVNSRAQNRRDRVQRQTVHNPLLHARLERNWHKNVSSV